MSQQFDVSPNEFEKIKANAKRRAELRNEFLKLSSDPFRHATGEGGTVFDPAMQRFGAMRVSTFEHFKANTKTLRSGLMLVVFPMGFFMWLVKNDRDKKEHKYRTGQVAYKDRQFKFI